MKPLNRWFAFADEDLLVAERAMEDGIFNQVCFHAQQGVEKCLKGFLQSHGHRVPKTHHLSELLGLCVELERSFGQFQEECLLLDRYYIPTRYPDALPGTKPEGLPNRDDAAEALEILRRLRKMIAENE